ncbi:MAG: hypothetical protein GDA53_07620 [Rhodobacteraceae bacterium]|nr:hypothetical protein [Paracoccaceae bacterium]
MLATTNIMGLSDPDRFADFLFNSKLMMGLETSFGKVVERVIMQHYPVASHAKWRDPSEKIAELEKGNKIQGREAKSAFRSGSIWREIDKDVVVGNRHFLTTIKSGPNTINDTHVQGMVDSISAGYREWLRVSELATPGLEGIDVVIGLTYGTEHSTNNKDNQILAKLLDRGFSEIDRETVPGVLADDETGRVRVYRRVGKPFWSWIGNPQDEGAEPQVFLEVLLALSIAFRDLLSEGATIEDGINQRLRHLASSVLKMQLSSETLPKWVLDKGFNDTELFYLVTAASAFYDEGI